MDEWNWDGNEVKRRGEEAEVRGDGKIFGNRGRGFQKPSSRGTDRNIGGWPLKNGMHNNNNNNWINNKENRANCKGGDDWDDGWKTKANNLTDNFETKDDDWNENWETKNNEGNDRGDRGRTDANDWGNWGRKSNGNDRGGRGRRNDGNDRGDRRCPGNDRDRTNDGSKPAKPKSNYIPEEPTEDENEIFGNGISSGINFSKYDDIEVKVSGENPPEPLNSFDDAGLRDFLLELIKRCNYSKPTPIQKYSIPTIMGGRDLMACAQTGSGKTAAFLIPIINNLLEDRSDIDTLSGVCKPQAVIVSPTRELTIQIFDEARKFSRGSFLKIAISYGGTAVFHQIQNISKGCHILVATPGRLLDFLKRGKIELSAVKFVVLDEADRMLDMGFLPDMERLMTHETMVPVGERQTLMFSATFPEEVQRLAGKFLNDYLFVAVGIVGGACTDVEQRFYSLTKFEKRDKLLELLTEMGSKKCLVFVEQKRTTDFIATFLCEKNFPATSIHGDREQREREEALRDFKQGKMDILVATSVAARGLDIKNVAHVINFDLPKSVDEYVHRIGRTGRVGNRGLATSFFDPAQDQPIASDLVKILTQAGQTVPDCLKDHNSHTGSYGGAAKFGGRDFRDQRNGYHSSVKEPDLGVAQDSTFEEEQW